MEIDLNLNLIPEKTNNSEKFPRVPTRKYSYWTENEQIVLLAGHEFFKSKHQKFKAILDRFAEDFKPEHQSRVLLKNKYDFIIKKIKSSDKKYINLRHLASEYLIKITI